MLGAWRRRRAQRVAAAMQNCQEQAGALFDGGYNCAQADLQATTAMVEKLLES